VLVEAQVSKTQHWRSSVKACSLQQQKVDLLVHLLVPLQQPLEVQLQQLLEVQALLENL